MFRWAASELYMNLCKLYNFLNKLISPLWKSSSQSHSISVPFYSQASSSPAASSSSNIAAACTLHAISSLSFSDTLIMCDAYWLIMYDAYQDQIYNLGHILLSFEAISSLKVNLWKSVLVAMGEVRIRKSWLVFSAAASPLCPWLIWDFFGCFF